MTKSHIEYILELNIDRISQRLISVYEMTLLVYNGLNVYFVMKHSLRVKIAINPAARAWTGTRQERFRDRIGFILALNRTCLVLYYKF